ncbi:caspase family protein [Tardiphaga sp. 37S4]|uniref:caspase family protein n=1 Tax=Tardiphaga sp. 37S4 TaxID=1404741 RepID=UPI001E39F123|nr:caspase family protein [Tardiphaga sp. 37S4]UFS73717.1 caspase family protein [Tardiphaga sp. 37S4]
MSKAYAVVIGIEKYFSKAIEGVPYAQADAVAFADILEKNLVVPKSSITLLLNEAAHKAEIEDQLKYIIGGLDESDKFYFFYAGHGLWAGGTNRLTTWDTQPVNLDGTTVNIEEMLLTPLRKSRCKQSAIFIDACATEFKTVADARDIVSEMHRREFEKFIESNEYLAAFFACSAKERSYSTPALGHGIWTYHLIEALRGSEPQAIIRDEWVTGESLRDYLQDVVPRYIRTQTKIRGKQQPYALIGASGTFALSYVGRPDVDGRALSLKPDFKGAYFRKLKTMPFSHAASFSRYHHTTPETHNDYADNWARKLLADDIAQELQEVYHGAKKTLGLKSRDVAKQSDVGAGTVDTEFFRFSIEAGQNPDNPKEVFILREVHLRAPHSELPADFESIFRESANELVLPLSGIKGQFEEIVDAIEERDFDVDVSDNPTTGKIEIKLLDGTVVLIDTKAETLYVQRYAVDGCIDIVNHIKGEELEQIIGKAPKLIGRKMI